MNLRNNKNNSYFLSSYNVSGTVIRCLSCIHLLSSPDSLASAINPHFRDSDTEASGCWVTGPRPHGLLGADFNPVFSLVVSSFCYEQMSSHTRGLTLWETYLESPWFWKDGMETPHLLHV